MFTTAIEMEQRPQQGGSIIVAVWMGCALLWAINFGMTLSTYLHHSSKATTMADVVLKGICMIAWSSLAFVKLFKLKEKSA